MSNVKTEETLRARFRNWAINNNCDPETTGAAWIFFKNSDPSENDWYYERSQRYERCYHERRIRGVVGGKFRESRAKTEQAQRRGKIQRAHE